MNCKSVSNKKGRFQNLIDSTNPDIVVVTESWLSPKHADGEIGEPGRFGCDFTIHRRDRDTDTHGGGVFIAVRNDLKSTQCEDLEPDSCELMWVKVEAAGEKALYVGAFYRSSVSDTEKLSPLNDSVTSLCHSTQPHVWLTGNFNLSDMEWNPLSVRNGARYSDSYQVFMDMLDEAALTQTVTEPTRDSNTLDLFATNIDTLITRCEVIPCISDHNAILVESRLRPLRQKTPRRSIPILRQLNWDGIRSHISQSWEQLTGNDISGKRGSKTQWMRLLRPLFLIGSHVEKRKRPPPLDSPRLKTTHAKGI